VHKKKEKRKMRNEERPDRKKERNSWRNAVGPLILGAKGGKRRDPANHDRRHKEKPKTAGKKGKKQIHPLAAKGGAPPFAVPLTRRNKEGGKNAAFVHETKRKKRFQHIRKREKKGKPQF